MLSSAIISQNIIIHVFQGIELIAQYLKCHSQPTWIHQLIFEHYPYTTLLWHAHLHNDNPLQCFCNNQHCFPFIILTNKYHCFSVSGVCKRLCIIKLYSLKGWLEQFLGKQIAIINSVILGINHHQVPCQRSVTIIWSISLQSLNSCTNSALPKHFSSLFLVVNLFFDSIMVDCNQVSCSSQLLFIADCASCDSVGNHF